MSPIYEPQDPNQAPRTPVPNVRIANRVGMMVNPPPPGTTTLFGIANTAAPSTQTSARNTANRNPAPGTQRQTSNDPQRQGLSAWRTTEAEMRGDGGGDGRGERDGQQQMRIVKITDVIADAEDLTGVMGDDIEIMGNTSADLGELWGLLQRRFRQAGASDEDTEMDNLVVVRFDQLDDLKGAYDELKERYEVMQGQNDL